MARRPAAAPSGMAPGAEPVSAVVPGRPLVTLDLEAGGPLPPPVRPGAVVRLRVRVEPDALRHWEEASPWRASLAEVLLPAAFVYPAEADLRSEPGAAEERRVLSARDPEAALREYVSGLGIPEGDAALALELGLDCLHTTGAL